MLRLLFVLFVAAAVIGCGGSSSSAPATVPDAGAAAGKDPKKAQPRME